MRTLAHRTAVAAATGAISLTAVLGGVAPASAAEPRTTQADLIGVVTIDQDDPTVGYVKARYRCFGDGSLWISVKQTDDRTADEVLTQEGSSQHSAVMSHSHRNPVTCNGKVQTQTFVLDQVEWGFGELAKGEGYVQFCLFDDQHPMDGGHQPFSRNEFLHVR